MKLLDGWVNGWTDEGGHDEGYHRQEGIIDRNDKVTMITMMLLTRCLLGTSHCEDL